MSRFTIILIASLLPVLAALTLFGALHVWASSSDALSTPIVQLTPDWDLGLIRHR